MAQVLLAENNELIRRLVLHVLRSAGHTVTTVTDRQSLQREVEASQDPLIIVLCDRMIAWNEDALGTAVREMRLGGPLRSGILLSAIPEMLRHDSRYLLWSCQVPLVPLPFDIERLAATVAWAAQHRLVDATLQRQGASANVSDVSPTAAIPYSPPSPPLRPSRPPLPR